MSLNKTKQIFSNGRKVFEGTFDEFKKMATDQNLDRILFYELVKTYFLEELEDEARQARLEREKISLVQQNNRQKSRWRDLTNDQDEAPLSMPPSIAIQTKQSLWQPDDCRFEEWKRRELFNRVTDFSSWVFRAHNNKTNYIAMAKGKIGERRVKATKKKIPIVKSDSDWELIYEDPLHSRAEVLEISSLEVLGTPMFGCPDYVFRHRDNGKILIVEIKVSERNIPPECWPNVQCQLWAYGHIDRFFENAPEVLLAAEVWDFKPSRRQTFVWRLSDSRFYQRNQILFDAFKSWIVTIKRVA